MSFEQFEGKFTHAGQISAKGSLKEFEEVRISVPWGHISGKWYGPKNIRPIVGIHGWQDNAGTFDTLAPLLPTHVGFLSLDLPGHGLSSRLPDGCYYNSIDNIYIIRMVMKEYNWEKISLLGHSMSSIAAFVFAAVFPDKVDMLICLDALKPHMRPIPKVISSIASRMESFLVADERNRGESEPPSYTYDELIEKLHVGSIYSVYKEYCPYILARNVKKSSKYPDKYFFTRDSRLKFYNYYIGPQELCVEMAKQITAPHLFLKASHSTYFEEKKYYDEVLEILQKKPNFEFHVVKGSHHVHLNNPKRVSDVINPFICKYRPLDVTSKL